MKNLSTRLLLLVIGILLCSPRVQAASVNGRVLDSTGRPLAGVRVQWLPYRAEARVILDETRDNSPAPLGETSTDAEGRFRVALVKTDISVAFRIVPSNLPSARLEGPFEAVENLSLPDIAIPPATKASGRVVDETGRPVSGARVAVIAASAVLEGEPLFLAETRTQSDGSFSTTNAPDGARVVLVRAPGFAPLTRGQLEPRLEERLILKRGGTLRGIVLDPAGRPVSSVSVTIAEVAGETDGSGHYEISGIGSGAHTVRAIWRDSFVARRDIVVRKSENIEASLQLVRATVVSGTVVEEGTRRPISGARVSAYPTGRFLFGVRRSDGTAQTDATGLYRLAGFPDSLYLVEASRDGYLTASMPNLRTAAGPPRAVNLALRRAAVVAGRVVDEKDQPVPGARVRIVAEATPRAIRQRGSSGAQSLFGRGGMTASDGSFRLRNLVPARNLTIEAEKGGYLAARQSGLTLKPGDAVSNSLLVLRRGLEARGRVIDAREQPVAAAQIRVALREAGGPTLRGQMKLLGLDQEKPDAVSGAEGGFVVRGLEEGEYGVTVAREGFATKSLPALVVRGSGENVWPPITLAPGTSISGSVRDSAGQPIVGARILAIDLAGAFRPVDTVSGFEGRFGVDGLTADRPLLLSLSAEGYAGIQKNVTPPAEDLTLTLKSAGVIRGRVEDADTKRPVTGFSLARSAPRGFEFNVPMGSGESERPFQSEDGAFELRNVPPGSWIVRAAAPAYRPAEVSGIQVGEAETREGVVFSLKRGGTLVGRVLDSRSGAGIANAAVSWESAGAAPTGAASGRSLGMSQNSSTNTDADGHFALEGLLEGKVMVTASHPDYLDKTREVDPSQENSVDLSLGMGGSISGVVVSRDRRTPVPGVQVFLKEQGDAASSLGGNSARADSSGRFLFEHLKPGRFKVNAQSGTSRTETIPVILGEGQVVGDLLVPMTTGTLLVGTVSGLPPGGLGGVWINARGNDFSDSTVTDSSGKFTLREAPAGLVRLNATTSFPSGRSISKSVEIPEGASDFAVEIPFEGTSRLSGRVTRADRPISGLFLSANPVTPNASATGRGRGTGQTDENGQYAIEGLSDGDYLVTLSGQGVAYQKPMVVSGESSGDIQLPSVQLQGTVTEVRSGEPLEGVAMEVQLRPQSGESGGGGLPKTAVTDSAGRYGVEDVDQGVYQVRARKTGYQAKTQNVTVREDSAVLNFGLLRGDGLSIRVVDGLAGSPLRNVTVVAFGGDASVAFQGPVSLDSTGKGEIGSLGPGQYRIQFFSDGYAQRTVLINVPSPLASVGMTPGGRIEIATAVALTGRVVDSSGVPYALNPWRSDGYISGAPPVVSWDHVAPGSYQLLVGAGGAEKPFTFTVVEGQTTRVEVK